ncbi:response regulator [Actinomadura luteofluorescens]|uniref:response regulator n=1 Tax=Actinomadura luteofluorescens TaxID=46163 RepID=UPI003485DE3C
MADSAELTPRAAGRDREPIRVLVADDNPVVRSGLASLLGAAGITVVGEAADGERAVALTERLRPDLVLLDVRMPLLDGIGAAAPLARISRVLMLTYSDDPEIVREAVANGAAGYLVHGTYDQDGLVTAVHDVVGGGNPLSPAASAALVDAVRVAYAGDPIERFGLSAREIAIVDLVARGLSNREIAGRLFLAEKTVKNHLNRVYPKIGVSSRSGAIALWLRLRPPQDD